MWGSARPQSAESLWEATTRLYNWYSALICLKVLRFISCLSFLSLLCAVRTGCIDGVYSGQSSDRYPMVSAGYTDVQKASIHGTSASALFPCCGRKRECA